MINTNDLIIGSVIFVCIYAMARFWLARKSTPPYQQELQRIIEGDEFKVKGRTESRADR